MKVLIVGSIQRNELPEVQAMFAEACREIGATLARSGAELVVGSDVPNTADRYAVEGAASVEGRHRVWVFRPDYGETPFSGPSDIALSGKLDLVYKRLRGPWAAGRVPQVLASDAVILIGGARGTATVGYVAPALGRPVVAVACFGGAAAELWSLFEPYYDKLGTLSDRAGNLRERWNSGLASLVGDMTKELIARRLFRAERRGPHGILLLAELFLLTGWIVLFTQPLTVDSYSFFAMMAVAAFLGTTLRNSLRLIFDPTAELSWVRLLNELTAGVLLAFGLALIYLVGGVTITGSTEPILLPKLPSDFQRVAVVMTILGLTGGLLIEQVAESLSAWLTDRLPKRGGP